MSNTVKIKNRKKKSEVKVNYKLWAIVFGVFVAIIVGLSVWASFHWGVGMGTVGVRPLTPEEAGAAASEIASEFATDGMITVTPEQLEQMGVSPDDVQAEDAEGAEAGAEAAEGADQGAETPAEDAGAAEAGDAAADDAAEKSAE
jgi:hypothetical protein